MAGNANSGKGKHKLFRDAIALAVHDADGKKLRDIAEKLVTMAQDGDMQAIKEVGDRLDGKPAQSHTHGGDAENPFVHRIERAIVDTNTKD